MLQSRGTTSATTAVVMHTIHKEKSPQEQRGNEVFSELAILLTVVAKYNGALPVADRSYCIVHRHVYIFTYNGCIWYHPYEYVVSYIRSFHLLLLRSLLSRVYDLLQFGAYQGTGGSDQEGRYILVLS